MCAQTDDQELVSFRTRELHQAPALPGTDIPQTLDRTRGTKVSFDHAPGKFGASEILHPHHLRHPHLHLSWARLHYPHFTGEETRPAERPGDLPTDNFTAEFKGRARPLSPSFPAGFALLLAYLPS